MQDQMSIMKKHRDINITKKRHVALQVSPGG